MNVEISKAKALETPASVRTSKYVEEISGLMLGGGINAISYTKYQAGFGSRLHVSVSQFADAPEDIKKQGVVIKDALAELMAIANLTRIVLNLDDKELDGVKADWDASIREAANSNSSSQPAQTNSVGSSGATIVL